MLIASFADFGRELSSGRQTCNIGPLGILIIPGIPDMLQFSASRGCADPLDVLGLRVQWGIHLFMSRATSLLIARHWDVCVCGVCGVF